MLKKLIVGLSIALVPSILFMGFDDNEVTNVENNNTATLASGSVSGIINFDKAYPKLKRVRVSKDNEVCGNIKKSKNFIVNKENRGLKNVLVTIEGVEGGEKADHPPRGTVDQHAGFEGACRNRCGEIGVA